jgi:hypothetical protein
MKSRAPLQGWPRRILVVVDDRAVELVVRGVG